MKILDLFSGIGAFSLGLQRVGMEPAAFCEIDPFCRDVLARHWPGVPIFDDIRELTAETLAAHDVRPDIICGGFPCTDVSNAGKRAGLAGANSGLYRELVRTIRMVRPKHAIVENVAALLGNGMGDILGDLAEIGDCRWIEWDCVSAQSIGAPHQRDRVWIVTHAPRIGCGPGRSRRPPDSFTWVRDATRWHAGHTYRAGLAERAGVPGDAREERTAAVRAARADVWKSKWPGQSSVHRVASRSTQGLDGNEVADDAENSEWNDVAALLAPGENLPDRVSRVRALGNSLVPQIPELIGMTIIEDSQT